MSPLVEALAEEYGGRADFAKVNVDESPELAAKLQIFSVPTFVVFVGGEQVKRFVGMATKEHMAGLLKPLVG